MTERGTNGRRRPQHISLSLPPPRPAEVEAPLSHDEGQSFASPHSFVRRRRCVFIWDDKQSKAARRRRMNSDEVSVKNPRERMAEMMNVGDTHTHTHVFRAGSGRWSGHIGSCSNSVSTVLFFSIDCLLFDAQLTRVFCFFFSNWRATFSVGLVHHLSAAPLGLLVVFFFRAGFQRRTEQFVPEKFEAFFSFCS